MSINELLNDVAFTEQVKAATSLDEVAKLLCEKGIEVTAEQLENAMKAEEGELDIGALDNVAGGGIGSAVFAALSVIGKIWPVTGPILGGPKRK